MTAREVDGLAGHPVRYSDLSPITVEHRLAVVDTRAVLTTRFTGRYERDGSDSAFIRAHCVAGVVAWSPRVMVVDLHELHYVGGDQMERVFDLAVTTGVPTLYVVGPRCAAALETLLAPQGLAMPEIVHSRADVAAAVTRASRDRYGD